MITKKMQKEDDTTSNFRLDFHRVLMNDVAESTHTGKV